MAIFKVPRITNAERIALILQEAEIVFETDSKQYYGGDGIALGGFPIGSGAQYSETFTLDLTAITNKQISLTHVPMNPSITRVLPIGGIYQRYGIDFTISGQTLSWDGLGLDNFLEVGDILIVEY